MRATHLSDALGARAVAFVASLTLRTKNGAIRHMRCVTTDKSTLKTAVFRWHEIGYIWVCGLGWLRASGPVR